MSVFKDLIILSREERLFLEAVTERSPECRAKAKAVLLSADGLSITEVAHEVGRGVPTITRWRKWFMLERSEWLSGASVVTDNYLSSPETMQPIQFTIADSDLSVLHRLFKEGAPRLLPRIRVILLSADGYSPSEITKITGMTKGTVYLWRRQYVRGGLRSLLGSTLIIRDGHAPILDRMAATGTPNVVRQAKVLQLAANGWTIGEIVKQIGVGKLSVMRWRVEYTKGGLRPFIGFDPLPPTVQGYDENEQAEPIP